MSTKLPKAETHNRERAQSDGVDSRDRSEKLRVVVGLFDQAGGLAAALEELMSRGFATANLCVTGSRDTVSMAGSVIQKIHNIDPMLVDLFMHTDSLDTAIDTQTVVGSQGRLLSLLKQKMVSRKKFGVTPAGEECSNITSELESHIRRGQMVLTVQAGKPRQMIHASRVLLRHSSHDIQTHECRLS